MSPETYKFGSTESASWGAAGWGRCTLRLTSESRAQPSPECSVEIGTGTTVAGSRGAKAVDDASALFDDPTIHAIDVCVPSVNHHEFVLAALQRGKHVFCETPFAVQLTAAEAMIEAAKHARRLFMVGLLERSIAQYEPYTAWFVPASLVEF